MGRAHETRRCRWVAALGALAACGGQARGQEAGGAARDPAPPALREPGAVEPPRAAPFAGLVTSAAPRPLAPGAVTEDWPTFLGPRRDGTSRESPLLVEWGAAGPALLWSMECGQGYAAPAVADGRVVFAHRVGGECHVDCLDAESGRRYWRFSYSSDYRGRYIADSGPRATPAIADGRVWVHGVEGRLHCLEFATGRVLWQRDLKEEFGLADDFFGVVASPLVMGEQLVIQVGAPGPMVAAFERRTGRLAWRADGEWGASCASPVLASVHGRPRLFVLAGGDSRPPTGGLVVADPATGALDFTYPFRSRTYESVLGASPLVIGERVFLSASYNTGSALLALDGEGGFEEVWRSRALGLQFSNPVELGGRVYALDGTSDRTAELVALDPHSGAELSRTVLAWEETVVYRGQERSLSFSVGEGSLLVAEGRLLCLGDNGHLLWLAPGAEGVEVLARASLFRANNSWTPPALSHGLLYVCQNNRERFGADPRPPRLLCFDLRGG